MVIIMYVVLAKDAYSILIVYLVNLAEIPSAIRDYRTHVSFANCSVIIPDDSYCYALGTWHKFSNLHFGISVLVLLVSITYSFVTLS